MVTTDEVTHVADEKPEPTARGDRDARRRDVLNAATELLDEAGWEGFAIRAVASRAGVSTGAVYQWFSGKDEIFAELYNHQIQIGLDLIETMPTDTSLHAMVRIMVDWVVALYESLGRYEHEFIEASTGRSGREIAPAMAATYVALGNQADAMLDQAAAREGIALVQNEYRITWFWAGCVGTAERLIVHSGHFADERREELLEFAADSLTRSLIDPAGDS